MKQMKQKKQMKQMKQLTKIEEFIKFGKNPEKIQKTPENSGKLNVDLRLYKVCVKTAVFETSQFFLYSKSKYPDDVRPSQDRRVNS